MNDSHGGNIWLAAAEAGVAPADIIDFSASINPFGPSPSVIAAVKNAAALIAPYPDPECAELRRALAGHHGVSPGQILAGNGSTEFIYLIPQVFKPRSALIVEPAFSEYKNALTLYGCRTSALVLVEEDGFCLDLKRLEAELEKGHDMLFLANPANPTGAFVKKTQMTEAAGLCKRLGVTMVIDEAFIDFCEEESFKGEVASFMNVIVLRSMTKFFAIAGLRLGYIIASSGMIKRFSAHVPPWSVNTLAAVAGAAALKDRAHVESALRRIPAEREAFRSMLDATGGLRAYPSAANFLMLRITAGGLTAGALKEALFRKNILVRDLGAFEGLGAEYLRVAVRSRSENAALAEAIGGILRERATHAGKP